MRIMGRSEIARPFIPAPVSAPESVPTGELDVLNGILHQLGNDFRGKKLLEIGTHRGVALVQFAAMAPGLELYTLNVLPEQVTSTTHPWEIIPRDEIGSAAREHGIQFVQYYGDSRKTDFREFGIFDVVFIDGCHDYDYVVSDSLGALRCAKPGALLIWHDYAHDGVGDVTRAVHEMDARHFDGNVTAVEGTFLAFVRVARPGSQAAGDGD